MGKPDVEVKLDDINIETNSTSTIDADLRTEIVVPQPIVTTHDIGLDIKPLKTENTFAITEPIVSENTSNIGLDVRPLTVDLCFKLELGQLPATCIRQPYSHHFGITLFGVEVLGFNFMGESQTVIESIPKKPQVIGGGQHTVQHHSSEGRPGKVQPESSGLRIRLE